MFTNQIDVVAKICIVACYITITIKFILIYQFILVYRLTANCKYRVTYELFGVPYTIGPFYQMAHQTT